MGETVPFQRRRRALPKPSQLTLSAAACELVGKVAIIDRVNPGAVDAINVVADQFVPKADRQVGVREAALSPLSPLSLEAPPRPVVETRRRLPKMRRPNAIKMLHAKLADWATRVPDEEYDAEYIANMRRTFECSIRAEHTLIRVRRLQSVLSLALVGA